MFSIISSLKFQNQGLKLPIDTFNFSKAIIARIKILSKLNRQNLISGLLEISYNNTTFKRQTINLN